MEDSTKSPYKLSIVVRKDIPIGVAINAASHLAAGMVNLVKHNELFNFCDFSNAKNEIYPSISGRSFVILSGDANQIKKSFEKAKEENIPANAFLVSMTGDGIVEQLQRTSAMNPEEIEFYGAAFFGTKEQLNPLTKKFRLFQ
jgi:hypothetical protein